ncbi:MAG: arsenate reductase ArsC [candidate division Zixibacteria bacterium]|nr:arsenate reductase ArsC [candidate division Zixibacteria bacterium]
MSCKLKILFLCTGNSCRSQMAEGWTRYLLGGMMEPYSAGIEAYGLNMNAVKVMAEAGIDISDHRSKHISDLGAIKFDYLITVCGYAGEHCPVFPGIVKKIHHGFDDPSRLALEAVTEEEELGYYRRVRDEIRDFIISLPAVLNKGE